MAINRFAITTDGFGKPETVSGGDWSNKTARALLITEGYLNRQMGYARRIKKSNWIYWMYFYYRKER